MAPNWNVDGELLTFKEAMSVSATYLQQRYFNREVSDFEHLLSLDRQPMKRPNSVFSIRRRCAEHYDIIYLERQRNGEGQNIRVRTGRYFENMREVARTGYLEIPDEAAKARVGPWKWGDGSRDFHIAHPLL